MKILIPMAGSGQRFIEAGYKEPKPLIVVDGITIIEHIIKNFSKDDHCIFGCNEEHIKNTDMLNLLKKVAPKSTIISMPYKKEGPIYGIKMMIDHLHDEERVIINYCDFSWVWDYKDFKTKVMETNCDGAVVCYKGFHPHLLGNSLYATLDSNGLWMKEIREKYSWHKNKMDDWSSSGTYYFKKGEYLKKYVSEIEKKTEWKINGEHYVSQLFQLMKEDGLKIFIYAIPFMLQWGTPEDLEEYLYWSDYFKGKKYYNVGISLKRMNVLVPMAGEGKRFIQEEYTLPKPLIQVDNTPMAIKAALNLPKGNKYIFIIRKEHSTKYNIDKTLKEKFNDIEVITTDYLTEGQASSALIAKDLINSDAPLMIGASDNGMTYDENKFNELISAPNVDALIFTFRNNPTVKRNTAMYGWVKVDDNLKAQEVSVKVPISNNPVKDHAVVGSFWFKKGSYFVENTEKMIKANDRINNEFYIDNCMNYLIKNGLNVYAFEVDKYICWGTPNDLRTYEYWQKYFDLTNLYSHKITV